MDIHTCVDLSPSVHARLPQVQGSPSLSGSGAGTSLFSLQQIQVFIPESPDPVSSIVRTLVKDSTDLPLPSFLDSNGMFNNFEG